jgi:hypothetical protein
MYTNERNPPGEPARDAPKDVYAAVLAAGTTLIGERERTAEPGSQSLSFQMALRADATVHPDCRAVADVM